MTPLPNGCLKVEFDFILHKLADYLRLSFEQVKKLDDKGLIRQDWFNGFFTEWMRDKMLNEGTGDYIEGIGLTDRLPNIEGWDL